MTAQRNMGDRSVLYFAYGSNMEPAVLEKACPGHRIVGPARLEDHRLAFTRKSRIWQAGVADVVPFNGAEVWGVLVELDEGCLSALDRKEGRAIAAYERAILEVTVDGERTAAVTYTVVEKAATEIPPSQEYCLTLIEAARHWGLPDRYLQFLERIPRLDHEGFRQGHVVLPTMDRTNASGIGIVTLPASARPPLIKRFRRRHIVAVSYLGRVAPAEVTYASDVAEGSCEMDQTIRSALGIAGRRCYGDIVQVNLVLGWRSIFYASKARTLTLALHRPSLNDSEKQICVVETKNTALIGVTEGDHITIQVIVGDAVHGYRLRKASRRVFSGSSPTVRRGGADVAYPDSKEFYLDLDGRLELGLAADVVDIPVLIRADLWRLFLSRALTYGATLFIGLLAVPELTERIGSELGFDAFASLLAGVALAIILTVALTLVDFRGRTRY